jgi:hypothetical protein
MFNDSNLDAESPIRQSPIHQEIYKQKTTLKAIDEKYK